MNQNYFIYNTVIFPQGRLRGRENIRRSNYNKPPEDGRRYNWRGHYHDYKFPVLSLFHIAELCLFTKIGTKNPNLCVLSPIHTSVLHFITREIQIAVSSTQPTLLLHGCVKHCTWGRGQNRENLAHLLCKISHPAVVCSCFGSFHMLLCFL
jgi:hypothetical protein